MNRKRSRKQRAAIPAKTFTTNGTLNFKIKQATAATVENINYLSRVSHLLHIVKDCTDCNLQLYKIRDLDYFVDLDFDASQFNR